MLYAVLVVALVVLDQAVKFLVRANIPLGGDLPFLPHILQLTYVQNTGAAFSLLEEHTWILTIVSLVVSVLLAVLLVKKVFSRPFAMTALSMVLAGAVGNLIDRALLGYVTDMFETLFMRFAVFNVADICVVVVASRSACTTSSSTARRRAMEPILLRADRAGERADQLLARLVPELTRSAAQRLLEAGAVTLGGRPVKKNDKAAAGDVLEVRLPEPEPVDVLPQDIPLDVAYEDADVIVVNKPVGLVVHPAAGHPDGTLVNALLYHCGESLSGINGALRPGIVHRIDRDTSGLLIAAKNDFAHQALAAQLQDHSLYREYEAVCVGGLREDGGTVDAPIGRHPTDRKKMCVDWKNGRPAVTHWTVLERFPGYTHIQCRLETGRTHQIRVHLASIGHPLLGDVVYGAKKPVPGLAGQCLHARRLSFVHPRTGERVTVECPLPAYFTQVLTKLRHLV